MPIPDPIDDAYDAWNTDEIRSLFFDLKRVARSLLRNTTALLNEAFVRLLGSRKQRLARSHYHGQHYGGP